MDKIIVKESTIVRPSQYTPSHTIWLSSLDLLVPKIHITTVYFYKPNGCPDFFDPELLKRALADVLVPFYPVAGRLGKDRNGRMELKCNGEGVLFVQAEASFAIDDFGDFTPGPHFRQLIPTVDFFSGDLSSYPFLLVQVTSFKCGGVCLGVGLHHTLADGASAINFINTWSDVARGLPVDSPPFMDRTLLRARNPPTPTCHHMEYDPPPYLTQELKSGPNATAKLKITIDQIITLKTKNNDDGVQDTKFTTYETVAAHVWRSTCRARGLPSDQASKLYIAMDGRSRLSPPLPRGFLGNVLFTATVVSAVGDVETRPLSSTMGRIRKALARMEDGYLRSALDYLEEQKDLTPLIRGSRTFSCPNMNIVSWIRLPVHDADFGWGKPVFMGPGSVVFEGMAYVVRSPDGDGSLDVFVCLESHHMERFRKFLYEF